MDSLRVGQDTNLMGVEWDTIETDNTIKTYYSYQSCEVKPDYSDTKHKFPEQLPIRIIFIYI